MRAASRPSGDDAGAHIMARTVGATTDSGSGSSLERSGGWQLDLPSTRWPGAGAYVQSAHDVRGSARQHQDLVAAEKQMDLSCAPSRKLLPGWRCSYPEPCGCTPGDTYQDPAPSETRWANGLSPLRLLLRALLRAGQIDLGVGPSNVPHIVLAALAL
jgi:hypothetical protein